MGLETKKRHLDKKKVPVLARLRVWAYGCACCALFLRASGCLLRETQLPNTGPEPHYLLRGEGKTSLCPRSRSLQGHSIHAKIHTRNASLQTSEPAGPHNRTAAPTARTLRQERGGAQLPLASGAGGLSIQFKLSFKLILEEIYTAYRFKAFPSSQRTGGQADGNEELLTLLRRQKSEASPGGDREGRERRCKEGG